MSEIIQKYSQYNIESAEEARYLLIIYILAIALEILVVYIAYRIIKRLIRYGIDYYFEKRDLYDRKDKT